MRKKVKTITIHFGPRMTAFIIRSAAMVGGLLIGAVIIYIFKMHETALIGGYGVAKLFESAGAAAADAIVEGGVEVLEG